MSEIGDNLEAFLKNISDEELFAAENLYTEDVKVVKNLRDENLKNILDFIDENRGYFSKKGILYELYLSALTSESKNDLSEKYSDLELSLAEKLYDLCNEYAVDKILSVVNFSVKKVVNFGFKRTSVAMALHELRKNNDPTDEEIELLLQGFHSNGLAAEMGVLSDEILNKFYGE